MTVTGPVAPCAIDGAHPAAMPATVQPQLPILVAVVPSGDQWLHEIKYDGYRIVARLARGAATLLSRNGKDWTAKFPTIAAAFGSLPVKNALFDGELVYEQSDGVTSFSLLAADLAAGRTVHLVYFVFDLLHLDDWSLVGAKLEDRKRALEPLFAHWPKGPIRCSRHVAGNGSAFYDLMRPASCSAFVGRCFSRTLPSIDGSQCSRIDGRQVS